MNSIKRYISIVVIFIFLSGCSLKQEEKYEALPVSLLVKSFLSESGVSESSIIQLCDYDGICKYLKSPEVTDERFEQFYIETHGDDEKLTDEVVKENFGFNSVEEYIADQKVKYSEHLKITLIMQTQTEIMDELISKSQFLISDDDIAEYSKNIVKGKTNEGLLYGYYDLEEYVQDGLHLTMDQFMEECTEKGKRAICEYLVIGCIAEKEGIRVDESINDIGKQYQELENEVFDLFIDADDDF